MSYQPTPTISVITATYNAAALLPRLIESLAAQTDQDFEWVVADGGSTDGTLEILENAKSQLKNVIIDSRPDFGIYDALNRAIKLSSGEYYVVMGADDLLFPVAIDQYKKVSCETKIDFVSARVISNDGIERGARSRSWEWLYGPFAYVSGHAVSLAIRKSLHGKYGLYSRKLPIAADQLFILRAIHGGARVAQGQFVAGRFDAVWGTSGQDIFGVLLEGYRVQLIVGNSFWLQTMILFVRLVKHRKTKKEV